MSGTDSFNLTLNENVIIRDNSANIGGGIGLNMTKADPADGYTYNITIDGAEIYNNNATSDGGAICCKLNYNKYNVNFIMKEGTVLNNEAQNGGAFYVAGCNFKMEGGSLLKNKSTNDGGAIYVTDSSYDNGSTTYPIGCSYFMTGGEVLENIANGNGGGVYVSGGDFTITNGIISGNEASKNGGGIYAGADDKDINVEVYGGEISNNEAGKHGGAIDVNMGTGKKANIIIGVEACKGEDITQHSDDGFCPIMEGNRAIEAGGGLCMHGDTNMVTVKMYCGELQNNVAVKTTGSGNMNQVGGTFIIYGGLIGNNVSVTGGEYKDERENAASQQITIRFHSNFVDGSENVYEDAIVTIGVILNLPGELFISDGHELSGWSTSATNGIEGYLPVNASYEVKELEGGYVDYYAVWDAETSYVITIPADAVINEDGEGTIIVTPKLTYFTEAATLSISLASQNNFELISDNSNVAPLEYMLSLNGEKISNDSTIAIFKWNDTEDRDISMFLVDKSLVKYSGIYQDIITFTISYDEGI